MQTYNTLNDAIALAKFAHFKQKDLAGFDYFDHPKRVMQAVQAQGAAPYVQMAAVLHDVTEDTAFTGEILLDLGFSPAVVLVVDLLDRKTSSIHYGANGGKIWGVGTLSQDEFYYHNIRNNNAAKMIKLADIEDNTKTYRLSYLPVDKQERLLIKYEKAKRLLNG